MRFIRAVIIALLSIFPGTIIGYLGWLATGSSENNYSPSVILFCNVIPFGFVFLGFIWVGLTGRVLA